MFEEGQTFWGRLPFIGRLLITASIALLIAASVMLFTSARQEAEDIRSDLESLLANELETLPAALSETAVIGDFATLQQTLDRYVRRPVISQVTFRDSSGTALNSYDQALISEAPSWFIELFSLRGISGEAPITVGNREYGTIKITLSPILLTDRAWGRLVRHLEILLMAIALDFIGIWFVLHQGLQPLRQLLSSVRHFSVTHEPDEIPPAGSTEIRQLILAFNDMATEVAYSQHELMAAKEAAEAANLAKSQFLATMSHEIRTPMNGILGMAQILMMPNLDEAERIEYIKTINASGHSLLTLLNDILDLSKVEAGKMKLEAQPFSPKVLVHDVVTLFAESGTQKGVSLSFSCANTVTSTGYIGDPHRIRQMLTNLVSNALKFTAHGKITVDVAEVSRDEGKATLAFSVTDTGMGIPAEKLSLLFKPFSQADSSTTRQFGGSGLGLSIVKNLAELMGGAVSVSSTVGSGSCFTFRCVLDIQSADSNPQQGQNE